MNDVSNNLPPDDVILVFIRQVCEHKPRLLPQIIQQATLGVQDFANRQIEVGGKMGFMMTQILDTTT